MGYETMELIWPIQTIHWRFYFTYPRESAQCHLLLLPSCPSELVTYLFCHPKLQKNFSQRRERKARTPCLWPTEDILLKFPKDDDAKEYGMPQIRFGWTMTNSSKIAEVYLEAKFGRILYQHEGLHKGYDSCPQLDHEDLEQIDEYDLEEMDLKCFDKTKLKLQCHRLCIFARECRIKGNQDNRKRDAWNSGSNGWETNGTKRRTLNHVSEPVVKRINVECQPRFGLLAPIIEEYESDSEDDLNHLIRDCDFNEKRMARKDELNNRWNNVQRVNKQNKFVPSAVLTRTMYKEEEQVFLDELEKLKRQEKEANEEAEALRKEYAQETENLVIQAEAAKASSTNLRGKKRRLMRKLKLSRRSIYKKLRT
ncbi:hypothetical protein Tco_0174191 [Tanacetum coccineum]